MKIIKITLAIVVIIAIAFFVKRSLQTTSNVDEISTQQNQFVLRIEQKIDSLKSLPDNKFSKNLYDEIAYYIAEDHKNSYLGSSTLENNQQEKNLKSTLYAVYAEKFIKEAFYVFNSSEWKVSDLNFIRKVNHDLISSDQLEQDGTRYHKFSEITKIINKYFEINKFISDAKSLKIPDGSSAGIKVEFPMSEVVSIIEQSNTYLNSNLENTYVNNCSRLKQELRDIPNMFFQKHFQYLNDKIVFWSEQYSQYNTQKAYMDNIFKPLSDQINQLNNDIYNRNDLFEKLKYLRDKWINDADKAWMHF